MVTRGRVLVVMIVVGLAVIGLVGPGVGVIAAVIAAEFVGVVLLGVVQGVRDGLARGDEQGRGELLTPAAFDWRAVARLCSVWRCALWSHSSTRG